MSFEKAELGTAGTRHAFDLLGMWVHQSGAHLARMAGDDQDVRHMLQERLTVPITDGPASIGLYPFSLEQGPPSFNESIVAGCFRNLFSYRKLIHPHMPVYSLARLRAALNRQGYRLEKLVGIYPPAFLFWWVSSVMAGTRFPDLHFRWEQTAMSYLSATYLPAIDFSHMIAFYARRLDP